jgi:hypothetical protein
VLCVTVPGLGRPSNKSSAVFRRRATSIPATIADTRLRPSSGQEYYARVRQLLFTESVSYDPTSGESFSMEPGAEGPADMAGKKDRCQRWRKIAIDQLGYALNLTLTFAIATLGYCFALLKDRDFAPASSAKCTMILSLLALAFSATCGFTAVVTRLWDFRGTARRACDHPAAPTKDELRGLGTLTWVLFYVQLGVFVIGVGALALTLLLTYGGKLK